MEPYRTGLRSHSSSAAVAVESDISGIGGQTLPANDRQRDLWLAAKLDADAGRAANLGWSLTLRGPLRIDALRTALDALFARHSALRAILDPLGEQVRIDHAMRMPWQLHDLRALGAARRDVVLEQHRQAIAGHRFELDRGPLLRCEVLWLEEQLAVLLLVAHGVICDRDSLALLARETSALYARAVGAAVELPAADDFAAQADAEATARDGQAHRAAQHYWRTQYREPPPALNLPTDRPRAPTRSFDAASVEHPLASEASAALRRLARQHDCSPHAVLLALQAAWLQRLAGNRDLVIATPLASHAHAPRSRLVGPFTRWLPVRIEVDPATPFGSLLAHVVRQLDDAWRNHDCGLAELLGLIGIGRDPSRPPLAAVAFDHPRAFGVGARSFPRLQAEYDALPIPCTSFELAVEAVEADGGITLQCRYRSDLFEQLTIRHWLHAFEQLLCGAEAQPQTALAMLPLVAGATLEELRALQPPVVPLAETWPHRLFARAAARHAGRPALRAIDARWSYRELQQRSARIANVLRARGVRPGARVGLLLDRRADAVATILAVLGSGAAYVPLDPGCPLERLQFMAADAGLDLLVSRQSLLAERSIDAPLLLLDADADALAAAAPEFEGAFDALDPWQTIAYIIYTSGSTGQPKGVAVPHGALASLLQGMAGPLGIGPDDRQLAVVRLSFDVSVQDLLLPLSLGAELVLASSEQARDPQALIGLVRDAAVTALEATPTSWRMLLDAGFVVPAGFRAMSAGEPLPMDIAERVIAQGGTFTNMYGPTETTVHCSWWQVGARDGGMAIGRPITNYRMWVLDENGLLCPLGVPGELCIAGDGVAIGYLGAPERAAERFIAEPDALRDPDSAVNRMYRSGDIGRWCADGLFECMGRTDGQVKLRGHRIETGEIEGRLRALPGLRDAAVVLHRGDADPRLVAYVVPAAADTFDPRSARAALAAFLPDFMLPQQFVVLDAMPCTVNGKTDRAALPPPSRATSAEAGAIAPRTPLEHLIDTIWRDLLPGARFGVQDDFFELGGHSLLAVRLFHAIAEQTGVNLPLATMYRARTIASLADEFASAGAALAHRAGPAQPAADPWHPLVPIRPLSGATSERPLFLIHAVGGNVMNYRRLAERLPPALPIYGLQAIGLDGCSAPLRTVAAMAERYLQEIIAVQPDGPYRLGGGSMGGVIAFEIARRLRQRGAVIEQLLLFDADLRPCVAGHTGARVGVSVARVKPLARLWRAAGARGQRLLDRLQAAGCRMLQRPLPHAVRYRHLQALNAAAYRGYRAASYDGPLTLFVARDERLKDVMAATDPALGWSVVATRLRIELVPGTHDTVVEQPELARRLARLLTRPALHSDPAEAMQ